MTQSIAQANCPKPETLLSQISAEQARAVFEQCGIAPHLWDANGFRVAAGVTISLEGSDSAGDTPKGNAFSHFRHGDVTVVSSGTLSDRVASDVKHMIYFSNGSTVQDLTNCLLEYSKGDTPFTTERMKARFDPTVKHDGQGARESHQGDDLFESMESRAPRFW